MKKLSFGLACLLTIVLVMTVQASPARDMMLAPRHAEFSPMTVGGGAKEIKFLQNNAKVVMPVATQLVPPFLHSEAKSSKAWNRVFFKKYPACYKDGHWAGLSQEQQLRLNDYLYKYGSNTYDPNDAEDCG